MSPSQTLEKENDGVLQVFRKTSVTEVVYVPSNLQEPHRNGHGSKVSFEHLSPRPPDVSDYGSSSCFLYFAVFIVNLLSFTSGVGMSWTSPVIPKLKSTDTPLNAPLDTIQVSWILSLLSIGEIIGPFFYGFLADKIGRKKTLISVVLPMIVGLTMTAFATDVRIYYFARFLHGSGIGGMFAVVPNFVAEISQPHNRGRLGMCCSLLMSFGVLVPYLIGPFLSIKLFSLVCVIPALIFLVIFSVFVPESPIYLVKIHRDQEAVHALSKFRTANDSQLKRELVNIKEFTHGTNTDQKVGISYLIKKCKKSFIIGAVLSCACQLTGIGVVVGFLQIIFQSANNTISPKYASIVVGSVKFLTMFVTSALIEKAGRKVLLLISCSGVSVSTILIGSYFFIKSSVPEYADTLWWLPLSCLVTYFIFFNLGIGSVSLALQSEIFPSNVRSLAGAFNTTLSFSLAFIIAFFFPVVNQYFGLAAPFWIFGFFSGITCFFIYWYIPETKGKSLAEIQELLR